MAVVVGEQVCYMNRYGGEWMSLRRIGAWTIVTKVPLSFLSFVGNREALYHGKQGGLAIQKPKRIQGSSFQNYV